MFNSIFKSKLREFKLLVFSIIFSNVFEKHLSTIFTKHKDIQVADTILYLFKSRDNIENYNKKAIYILIRERTGVNSQNITNVLNKIKKIYMELFKMYRSDIDIEKLTWFDMQNIIKN